MRKVLAEYQVFLREFRRNFHSTGALAPSSGFLALALSRFVGRNPGRGTSPLAAEPLPGRRILEIGPGTGAITKKIVRRLRPADQFDLVEVSGSFVEVLKRRFETEPPFRAVADRVRIIHGLLQDLPREPVYDIVISGLPLNNFKPADVEEILECIAQLTRPGGTFSFFEYLAVRPMRAAVSNRSERQRLRDVGAILKRHLHGREFRRDCVLANFPPAWVHHVRLDSPSGSSIAPATSQASG